MKNFCIFFEKNLHISLKSVTFAPCLQNITIVYTYKHHKNREAK